MLSEELLSSLRVADNMWCCMPSEEALYVCRVAELEQQRGKEHGEHGKLERLEACTTSLLEGMQLERDNVRLVLSVYSCTQHECCQPHMYVRLGMYCQGMQLERDNASLANITITHNMCAVNCMYI